MFARLLVVPFAVLVAGCVTKPEMSREQYSSFANGIVAAKKCASQDYIGADIAAYGLNYVQRQVDRLSYNSALLDSEVASLSERAPSREYCKEYEISVLRSIQLNAEREKSLKALNDSIENSRRSAPRSTVCNQVGNQTICTTQ